MSRSKKCKGRGSRKRGPKRASGKPPVTLRHFVEFTKAHPELFARLGGQMTVQQVQYIPEEQEQ